MCGTEEGEVDGGRFGKMSERLPTFFLLYRSQLIIMSQKSALVLQPTLFSLRLLLFIGTHSHCMTWACLWLDLPCTFWSKWNKLETKAREVRICNSCRTWAAAQKSPLRTIENVCFILCQAQSPLYIRVKCMAWSMPGYSLTSNQEQPFNHPHSL